MFILKRQDVEISSIQHPTRDQQVPILYYQEQTFRLISVFKASQEMEAKALWRSLTDNRGKACVLLEEPDRYSVWGKIRLEQSDIHSRGEVFTLATIMLLQAVYLDIAELLGNRQASLFEKDISGLLQQKQFPEISSPEIVKTLLTADPSQITKLPPWQEAHWMTLLEDLHKLGKSYFGDTNFAHQVDDRLTEMPEDERSLFISWLSQSPLSKLWH
ncbi:hypothetical protein VB711_18885 [Cronbergia sp. UHCC 0137]|uniref:Npun_F0813 family protein n=1 Tax=Cronbergia sp. UHCC 0137 TaxID=3110239 RepID=UPI002B21A037|nr:Npun_F0813 family protein [Cronbergia sp. UHCC 0137]MEA5619894.1 hypothetical protein [Cronbergia sp. UHCC 0137]